jgi:ribbon-helix-helix CopG family protein
MPPPSRSTVHGSFLIQGYGVVGRRPDVYNSYLKVRIGRGGAVVLQRKNLMVESAQVRALARRLGVSQSEAVRRAVQLALASEDIVEGLRRLRERGTFVDVYHHASKA